MTMTAAALLSSPPTLSPIQHRHHPFPFPFPFSKTYKPTNRPPIRSSIKVSAAAAAAASSSSDNGGARAVLAAQKTPIVAAVEKKVLESSRDGAVGVEKVGVVRFEDERWVNGTWDLKRFEKKDGSTDWDAVIDAEARRRKWLQNTPESSSNDNPVYFDTSIIPWWAWIKKFHLPEAELLNGRAAMIGFFMAYFVDSLTGVGLVDQMGNFVCKTFLFVAVLGVLLIRKNEDLETLKKLLEETTFYDKQWQATWQEDPKNKSRAD